MSALVLPYWIVSRTSKLFGPRNEAGIPAAVDVSSKWIFWDPRAGVEFRRAALDAVVGIYPWYDTDIWNGTVARKDLAARHFVGRCARPGPGAVLKEALLARALRIDDVPLDEACRVFADIFDAEVARLTKAGKGAI